ENEAGVDSGATGAVQLHSKHRARKDGSDRSFNFDGLGGIHVRRPREPARIFRPARRDQDCYQRPWANLRLPPPEGRAPRSSRGRASFTVRARPPTCLPLSAARAASACALSFMVTNAKPRDLPVMRSIISATSLTWPCCSKRSWRSFSVVSKERLPTYNFICDLIWSETASFRAVPGNRVSNHH